jgi:hypothetical protein
MSVIVSAASAIGILAGLSVAYALGGLLLAGFGP